MEQCPVDALGVFCPFWPVGDPHFIMPHFQGTMRAVGLVPAVLDLNIACAEGLGEGWPAALGNVDGLWSDPPRVSQAIEASGVAELLLAAILRRKPAWILFLGVNVASAHAAAYLMRRVREAYGEETVRLAVGGPICSHIGDGGGLFPLADVVWDGALEQALPVLFASASNSASAMRERLLQRVRPDFTGLDMEKYTQPEQLTYLLNFGCRFNCRFCHEGSQHRRELARPTDGLAAELRSVMTSLPAARYVRIFDSSINSDHQQFLMILDELSGAGIQWTCWLSPTPKIDAKIAQRMVAAGCIGVNVGVESGSTAVRKRMGKPVPHVDMVEMCLRNIHSAGIMISIGVMVGYPGEEDEHFNETLDFLSRTADLVSYITAGKAAIFKGTPLFDLVCEWDIMLMGDLDKEFVFNHWRLRNGSNTPDIRAGRLSRLLNHMSLLGIGDVRAMLESRLSS